MKIKMQRKRFLLPLHSTKNRRTETRSVDVNFFSTLFISRCFVSTPVPDVQRLVQQYSRARCYSLLGHSHLSFLSLTSRQPKANIDDVESTTMHTLYGSCEQTFFPNSLLDRRTKWNSNRALLHEFCCSGIKKTKCAFDFSLTMRQWKRSCTPTERSRAIKREVAGSELSAWRWTFGSQREGPKPIRTEYARLENQLLAVESETLPGQCNSLHMPVLC